MPVFVGCNRVTEVGGPKALRIALKAEMRSDRDFVDVILPQQLN